MNLTEFQDQISKLLIFYRKPPPDANDIYWNALRNTSADIFEKACDIIINTYEKVTFPFLPVFHDAIKQANREMDSSSPVLSSVNCPTCRGIGMTIIDNAAHPCSCSKGLIYKRSFDRVRIKTIQRRKEQEPENVEAPASGDPY